MIILPHNRNIFWFFIFPIVDNPVDLSLDPSPSVKNNKNPAEDWIFCNKCPGTSKKKCIFLFLFNQQFCFYKEVYPS